MRRTIFLAVLLCGVSTAHAATCDERKAIVGVKFMAMAHAGLDMKFIEAGIKAGRKPSLSETISKMQTMLDTMNAALLALQAYVPDCKPDQASAITYLQARITEASEALDEVRAGE